MRAVPSQRLSDAFNKCCVLGKIKTRVLLRPRVSADLPPCRTGRDGGFEGLVDGDASGPASYWPFSHPKLHAHVLHSYLWESVISRRLWVHSMTVDAWQFLFLRSMQQSAVGQHWTKEAVFAQEEKHCSLGHSCMDAFWNNGEEAD